MRRFLSLLFIGAAFYGAFSHFSASGSTGWQKLDNGLEMRVVKQRRGLSTLTVTAIRARPSQIGVGTGALLRANGWAQKTGAKAVVNGGYFDEVGKPLGLRIGAGKRVYKLRSGVDWGVFYIRDGRAQIRHTRDYVGSTRTKEAIQCGPRLVVNGRVTDLKPQWARRTGIGIDGAGNVVLAVTDGEMLFDDWAKIWANKGGLNCPNALNLDGGGSTQLYVKSKKPLEVGGAWSVPDVVFVR